MSALCHSAMMSRSLVHVKYFNDQSGINVESSAFPQYNDSDKIESAKKNQELID